MPGRLEGKVAIVTGGGSGFGKAISTKYIAEGAKVMIAELRADAGSAVAKELGCESVEADVTKRADWEKVLKQTVDTYGGVDIVVNNAGACYSRKVDSSSLRPVSSIRLLIPDQSLPGTQPRTILTYA